MNKDITLEEYTNKFNRIFADKKGKEFTQEELRPLWQSLQNDDDDRVQTYKWVFFPMRFKNSLN